MQTRSRALKNSANVSADVGKTRAGTAAAASAPLGWHLAMRDDVVAAIRFRLSLMDVTMLQLDGRGVSSFHTSANTEQCLRVDAAPATYAAGANAVADVSPKPPIGSGACSCSSYCVPSSGTMPTME